MANLYGGEGIFVKTDVSNEDSIKGLVEKTVKSYGRLNYAFNNTGVAEDPASFTDKTSSIFDKIMATNVKGFWLSMKHEIPQMLRNGGGAIVNTSSVYGVIGNPQPLYVASKHAVLGLTKAAALEYAKDGIRINAVAPGAIETEMMEQSIGHNKELRENLIALHPIGRPGKPEEIATVGTQKLRKDGVEVILNTRLVGAERDKVNLSDRVTIPCNTLVWTGGTLFPNLASAIAVVLPIPELAPVTTATLCSTVCILVVIASFYFLMITQMRYGSIVLQRNLCLY